jgi:hypothetical protein
MDILRSARGPRPRAMTEPAGIAFAVIVGALLLASAALSAVLI